MTVAAPGPRSQRGRHRPADPPTALGRHRIPDLSSLVAPLAESGELRALVERFALAASGGADGLRVASVPTCGT